jgi:hypothetical protein
MPTAPLIAATWIASLSLLRLVIFGSLAGLALAVVVLLVIWWREWRSGKAW